MEGKGKEAREGTPRKNPGYGPAGLQYNTECCSMICAVHIIHCRKLLSKRYSKVFIDDTVVLRY